MSGVTVYAVEHGDYSDRRTEVLFTSEALAHAYIEAREAAAKRYDQEIWGDADEYGTHWVVVTYQLWDVVPVVPPSLDRYDDIELPEVPA